MGLNVGDCLRFTAKEQPQATCLVFDALRLKYAEVDAAARRVAGMLIASGIRPGDRVALILPNVPQFPIAYYGILYAGATVIPLNPLLRPKELAHVVTDAKVRAVFAFEDIAATAIEVFGNGAGYDHLFVVESGMDSKSPVAGRSFMHALMGATPVEHIVDTNPEDIAVILYTAAQNGKPRGAMLSHFNLFNNAMTISTRTLKYFPEDIFLCVLPLFHGFGQTTMMNAPLLTGSCIVLSPRFDAGHTLDLIDQEKVTLMALVPTMLHFLATHSKENHPALTSLRCVVAGGSKLNLDTAETFTSRYGIPVLEGYGLSETSPVVAFNCSPETNRPGSVGPPIWGCEVGILDDSDHPVPQGKEGEVGIRGHNVFQGYLNDPEGTREVLRNGWLHTGDLGFMDGEGYLHLTGLKKDMILRAGMNVYPREVESALETHPDVVEVAVMGLPDVVRGEDVKAYVVLKSAATVTENDIKAYAREVLSSYKCPRRVEFVGSLPRLPDGRLDKVALKTRVGVEVGN